MPQLGETARLVPPAKGHLGQDRSPLFRGGVLGQSLAGEAFGLIEVTGLNFQVDCRERDGNGGRATHEQASDPDADHASNPLA